jgi:hypothetical protein
VSERRGRRKEVRKKRVEIREWNSEREDRERENSQTRGLSFGDR